MKDSDARRLEEQLRRFIRWYRAAHPPIAGLSQGAIMVISAIIRAGAVAQPGEISRELAMSTSNVAAALRELEAVGYITRDRDLRDARRVNITLTENGRRAMAERRATKTSRLQEAVSATLDVGEQRALLATADLLERVANYPTA